MPKVSPIVSPSVDNDVFGKDVLTGELDVKTGKSENIFPEYKKYLLYLSQLRQWIFIHCLFLL